uniref:Putative secreted protein n=1 Tax=Amblyomma triste TaxID=251400 RepID=A0A023G032_AMBTT
MLSYCLFPVISVVLFPTVSHQQAYNHALIKLGHVMWFQVIIQPANQSTPEHVTCYLAPARGKLPIFRSQCRCRLFRRMGPSMPSL